MLVAYREVGGGNKQGNGNETDQIWKQTFQSVHPVSGRGCVRYGSTADSAFRPRPRHSRPYVRDIAGRDIRDSRDMRDNC